MNATDKRRQFLTTLNLILTALILLGVIIVAGWLLMLDQQVNQLNAAAGELAAQLTIQSDLDQYTAETESESEPAQEQAAVEEEVVVENDPTLEPTPAYTITPKPTESEMDQAHYESIVLVPNPMLKELSTTRHFRLPPLEFQFPEDWNYIFDTNGTLTLTDPFGNAANMQIWAVNDMGEFLLNQIGIFETLADGSLSWSPDTTPRQGLVAGTYHLSFEINDYTSEEMEITVEDAPMARILEAVSMYRTFDDILEDRRYLSFASQQEPMSMYGYTIGPDGNLYIRVWRAHDKFYYWVRGDFVMHPEKGLLYNDLEDLEDDDGNLMLPKIETN